MGKFHLVPLPADDPIFKEGWSISGVWRPPQAPKAEPQKDESQRDGEGDRQRER